MWFHIVFGVCCLVFNVTAQTLGGDCRTPLGEGAKCVSVWECQTLLPLMRLTSRTSEQTQFLHSSRCGFDSQGTPYVCCGTKINNVATVIEPDNNTPYKPNPLIPDRNNCGIQVGNKFHTDETINLNEFPWMAVLLYMKPNGQRKIACGGSLINSRYVVTAAHCVTGDDLAAKVGQLINVRLGEYDTSSSGRDCIVKKGISICNGQEVNVGIDQILPHPRYTGDTSRLNDIALIRLASTVQYSDFIQPVCLPLPTDASLPGTTLIVAGWGRTENGRASPIKLKLEVLVTTQSQCANAFSPLGVNIGSNHICAGSEEGKDSCTGDSGGPLMRTLPTDGERWMIEGLVSFGYNKCGEAGYPGVYTRIAKYVTWIHQNVRA